MAFIFGGYWMSTDTAFQVITALGIDHSKDIGMIDTEYLLNEWLVDHDMLHFKAAGVDYDPDPSSSRPAIFGFCFISRFKRVRGTFAPPLVEGEAEDIILKSWLMNLGVDEKELRWISNLDEVGITKQGTQPRKYPTKFVDKKPVPPYRWKTWGDEQ